MTWGDFFYPHKVRVQDLLGRGSMGDVFGEARTLRAEIRDTQILVTGADGAQVTSSAQVTVASDSGVVLGSRVTIWVGSVYERTYAVLAVSDNPDTGDPLDDYTVLSLGGR